MADEINNFLEHHYMYFVSKVFAKKNPPPKPKARPDETSDAEVKKKKKTAGGGDKEFVGQHKVWTTE